MRQLLRNFTPEFITHIRTHLRHQGYIPNIFSPKTFNEKICYRKIFDRREILTQFADKYAVRGYVAEKLGVGFLPELYHVTENPSDIPFDNLPEKFVVKPTHGSGWVQLVKNKANLNRQTLIDTSQNWLNQSYYERTREWPYKNITPRIIIEQFIDDGSGDAPADFKFNVFDGKVRMIQVHIDRFKGHKRGLYDCNWKRFNVRDYVENSYQACEDVPRPMHLEEMIKASETLGQGLDYIRADFYTTKEKIYFGELTTTPGNGVVRYDPPDFDEYLGQFWHVKTT